MKKEHKHYKFINNETDNVIYYLSVPANKADAKEVLESARHKLAIENGIFIESIYYLEDGGKDTGK
jgi:hypothetical protein